jgi:hypothetical protein
MELNEQILRIALDYKLVDEDDPIPNSVMIERMGCAAFDWFEKVVTDDSTSDEQKTRALSLMSLTTRHNCPERKKEFFDLCVSIALKPRLELNLRKFVVNAILWMPWIAKGLTYGERFFGRPLKQLCLQALETSEKSEVMGLSTNDIKVNKKRRKQIQRLMRRLP